MIKRILFYLFNNTTNVFSYSSKFIEYAKYAFSQLFLFLETYTLLSVFLLTMAFNFPTNFGFLIFVSLAPLFYFYFRNLGSLHKTSSKGFLVNIFFLGLSFSILSTTWFYSIHPLTWLNIDSYWYSFFLVTTLWLVLGVFMASPVLLFFIIMKSVLKEFKDINFTNLLNLSFLWVLMEFFRSILLALPLYSNEVLFGPHHTYYSLSYPVYNVPLFKDLFPLGGMYLVSFGVVLANFICALLLFYFLERKKVADISMAVLLKRIRKVIYTILVLVLLVLLLGQLQKVFLQQKEGKFLSLYVSNARYLSSSSEELYKKKVLASIEKITEISREKREIGANKHILLLPENFDVYKAFTLDKSVLPEGVFVAGSFTKTKEVAYFINTDLEEVNFYKKRLLMPLGEYKPDFLELVNKLFFFNPGKKIDTRVEKDFSSNTLAFPSLEEVNFVTSICSENISPYLFREGVLGGGNIILNLSSHAPFRGNRVLERQTLAINSVRALETGRYLLTVSNFADSFVVDNFGELKLFLDNRYMKDDTLLFREVEVELIDYKNLYMRFGDWILLLAILFLLPKLWLKAKV